MHLAPRAGKALHTHRHTFHRVGQGRRTCSTPDELHQGLDVEVCHPLHGDPEEACAHALSIIGIDLQGTLAVGCNGALANKIPVSRLA